MRIFRSCLAFFVVVVVFRPLPSANGLRQASPQTSEPDGLRLLHRLQDALGGASRIAAVHDFEETIRAQAWDAAGTPLGEVRKRTRWVRTPNVLRIDQRGPRGTYVLYYDGGSGSGWELLPELTGPDPFKTTGTAIALAGGELRFAKGYLSGFDLNMWLADQLPGYRVTSSAPQVLRIEHGDPATDFTLDPVTSLPTNSSGVSLADPQSPGARRDAVRRMAPDLRHSLPDAPGELLERPETRRSDNVRYSRQRRSPAQGPCRKAGRLGA
jgi:hypothetical protein